MPDKSDDAGPLGGYFASMPYEIDPDAANSFMDLLGNMTGLAPGTDSASMLAGLAQVMASNPERSPPSLRAMLEQAGPEPFSGGGRGGGDGGAAAAGRPGAAAAGAGAARGSSSGSDFMAGLRGAFNRPPSGAGGRPAAAQVRGRVVGFCNLVR